MCRDAGLVVVAMAGQGKAVDYVAHRTQRSHIGDEGCHGHEWGPASIEILRMAWMNLENRLKTVAARGRSPLGRPWIVMEPAVWWGPVCSTVHWF